MSFLSLRSMMSVILALLVSAVVWGCSAAGVREVAAAGAPDAIVVEYSWIGLSPTATRQRFQVIRNAGQKTYQVLGETRIIPYDRQKPEKTLIYEAAIPESQVRQLLETVAQGEWTPADKPAEAFDHTDDYPNLTLTFREADKATLFQLKSTSNTQTRSPWNLVLPNDNLYVSREENVGQAILDFYRLISPPPDQWMSTTPKASPQAGTVPGQPE